MELLVNFLDEHEEIDLAAYRYILFYEDGTKKERPVYKRKFYKGTGIYDDYYEGLMKKYNNHPLIQTLIVHNVNWRMNEGFLKEKDLVNIRKNLKKSRFFIIW